MRTNNTGHLLHTCGWQASTVRLVDNPTTFLVSSFSIRSFLYIWPAVPSHHTSMSAWDLISYLRNKSRVNQGEWSPLPTFVFIYIWAYIGIWNFLNIVNVMSLHVDPLPIIHQIPLPLAGSSSLLLWPTLFHFHPPVFSCCWVITQQNDIPYRSSHLKNSCMHFLIFFYFLKLFHFPAILFRDRNPLEELQFFNQLIFFSKEIQNQKREKHFQ